MGYSNQFFNLLGVDAGYNRDIAVLSKKTGIPSERLHYYNDNSILPIGKDLDAITKCLDITELELMIGLGRLDADVVNAIMSKSKEVSELIRESIPTDNNLPEPQISFSTNLGRLYNGDCLKLLKTMDSESVDMIFADPPFNLNKLYSSKIDDNLKSDKYLEWCQGWLKECSRVLKNGGSLFLWNLPRWNVQLANYLNGYLTFRHWIGVDIKYSLPISGRLYPSHYSLLYYVKGEKPKSFHPDRLAMATCPKCYGDLKDYGGYKDKMNPLGVNLTDIWLDIPPVRHAKYKRRQGANELSLKLMDRIIEMSSEEGDVVFDPFGGSGTTYMAAELKGRRWIGCEIGEVDDIKNRFSYINEERKILDDYRSGMNKLFPDKTRKKRNDLGLWTCETFN
jgi:site-specific DNA-methyltransferase (adenine-specific)